MKDYVQINKAVYDALAKEYAFRRDNLSEYSESAEYLGGSLLQKVSKRDCLNVLEIGPGAGQILKYFEDNGCRTIGVELSQEMTHLCRIQSPNSIIINGDIADINFMPEQFDLIYMGALIHLFPVEDATTLLKNVWKWLKYDGFIFVNTTCHSISQEGFSKKKDYSKQILRFRRYWREEDFERFISENNFSIVEKLYTYERDRRKKWVARIGKKDGIHNDEKS